MREDLDARIALAIGAQVFCAEPFMHLAVPMPQDDLDRRTSGDVSTQELVRQEDDPPGAE